MPSIPCVDENTDDVKSAGCLLWGSSGGAVYAEACCRLSRMQSSGMDAGQVVRVVYSYIRRLYWYIHIIIIF